MELFRFLTLHLTAVKHFHDPMAFGKFRCEGAAVRTTVCAFSLTYIVQE